MTVAVIVQARTGSTRLPGKVLKEAAGATLLQRMLERVAAAETADRVVVATTVLHDDDPVVDVAHRAGFDVVRGHPTDLLDRHVLALHAVGGDVAVKIPSDCPLIDPATIDRVIGAYHELVANNEPADYVSNLHPPTWPDGFDVEVMSSEALAIAWSLARKPLEREHTTPYLWDNPDRFRIRNVVWETGLDYSQTYRLTLDYPEDYALIRAVYAELWSPDRHFTLAEIVELLASRPDLCARNSKHIGTSWYRNHPGELRTLPELGGSR